MTQSSYLDAFPVVRTTDPEEMRSALLERYGARDFDYPSGVDGFFGCGNHLQLGGLGLSFCAYSTAVEVQFDEFDAVRQQFCLQGNAHSTTGSRMVRTFDVAPDRSCVINAHQDATVKFGAGYQQLVLKIDEKLLMQKFTALAGQTPRTPFVFDEALDLETPDGQNLKQTVLMLAGLFSAAGRTMSSMILAELEQTATVALLSCNGHNLRHFLEAAPPDAAPWQVRSIEDYIETHWNTAITVENLAQIANTSARSIFKAFRKSRGYSPMAFAKKVRLRRARAMLLEPEAHTSVVGVAFACGFGNPGHFARDYRLAFGEVPSATLKRAKGHSVRQGS